jgi:hypothetical protein
MGAIYTMYITIITFPNISHLGIIYLLTHNVCFKLLALQVATNGSILAFQSTVAKNIIIIIRTNMIINLIAGSVGWVMV